MLYLYKSFQKIQENNIYRKFKGVCLQTYTTDFETALVNSLKKIFPNAKRVGCYYHDVKNIRQYAKKHYLIKYRENKNEISSCKISTFIRELCLFPYKYHKNPNIIEETFNTYDNGTDLFLNFKNYFNKYWKTYFINGELDYAYLTKNQRSNSYIENYNGRIK